MNRKSKPPTAYRLSPENSTMLSNISVALEYDIPSAILTNPTPAICSIFFHKLAIFIFNSPEKRIAFRQSLLDTESETPEFYYERIETFFLLTSLGSFMTGVLGINDFSYNDINASPKRMKKILESILNYLYFREEMVAVIIDKENKAKAQKAEVSKFQKKKKAMQNQLAKQQKEKEQAIQELKRATKENLEFKKESEKIENLFISKQKKLQKMEEENASIRSKNENLRKEIDEIKANKKELDYILKQDPLSMKKNLEQKGKDSQALKDTLKELCEENVKLEMEGKEYEKLQKLAGKRTTMVDSFLSDLLSMKISQNTIKKLESDNLELEKDTKKIVKEIKQLDERLKELDDYRDQHVEKRQNEIEKNNALKERYNRELEKAEDKKKALVESIEKCNQTVENIGIGRMEIKEKLERHKQGLEEVRREAIEAVREYNREISKTF